MSAVRDALDIAERAVRWIATPERRIYGPGLTANQVEERHNQFLRSGWSRADSGAYHRIHIQPETIPASPWPELYPWETVAP